MRCRILGWPGIEGVGKCHPRKWGELSVPPRTRGRKISRPYPLLLQTHRRGSASQLQHVCSGFLWTSNFAALDDKDGDLLERSWVPGCANDRKFPPWIIERVQMPQSYPSCGNFRTINSIWLKWWTDEEFHHAILIPHRHTILSYINFIPWI